MHAAVCVCVCSRWKSQWNQELLWISHAETHASLPFRVCKTCHSWKEVRSSEMTCCATSHGGCYQCFVLCPGMVTNLGCPVDYNSQTNFSLSLFFFFSLSVSQKTGVFKCLLPILSYIHFCPRVLKQVVIQHQNHQYEYKKLKIF